MRLVFTLALLCTVASADTPKKAATTTITPTKPLRAATPGRRLGATSGTIAFPTSWGSLTIKCRRASIEYDDTGTPVTMLIQGDAVDSSTPPVVRGHVGVVYTYATGALIQMNGTPILTATAAQQTIMLNSANLGPTILGAAITAAAAAIITP